LFFLENWGMEGDKNSVYTNDNVEGKCKCKRELEIITNMIEAGLALKSIAGLIIECKKFDVIISAMKESSSDFVVKIAEKAEKLIKKEEQEEQEEQEEKCPRTIQQLTGIIQKRCAKFKQREARNKNKT